MSKVVVFGAGGRAGRRAVSEAVGRGHAVTSVVRDPARGAAETAEAGATVVAGDVTDADRIAAVAAGHDVAIVAVYPSEVPLIRFYERAAVALLDGLARAGVRRALVVGLALTLETAPGVRVMDGTDLPADVRDLAGGHAALLDVLARDTTGLDWVVFAPPMTVLDDVRERTGRYRIGGRTVLPDIEGAGPLSYADLAVALVDEIERPRHHKMLVAVASAADR